jgi:hypothetical protein
MPTFPNLKYQKLVQRKCRPRGIEGIQAKEDRKRTLDPIENLCQLYKKKYPFYSKVDK